MSTENKEINKFSERIKISMTKIELLFSQQRMLNEISDKRDEIVSFCNNSKLKFYFLSPFKSTQMSGTNIAFVLENLTISLYNECIFYYIVHLSPSPTQHLEILNTFKSLLYTINKLKHCLFEIFYCDYMFHYYQ